MPSTTSKENAGRLRNFKNKGRDQDVSGLCFQLVTFLLFICFVIFLSFAGDETAKKRRDSGAEKGEPLLHCVVLRVLRHEDIVGALFVACG